jgi:hypothetical protein
MPGVLDSYHEQRLLLPKGLLVWTLSDDHRPRFCCLALPDVLPKKIG